MVIESLIERSILPDYSKFLDRLPDLFGLVVGMKEMGADERGPIAVFGSGFPPSERGYRKGAQMKPDIGTVLDYVAVLGTSYM